MHKDLLAHTSLLALPIAAMFLFLAVFVGVVVVTIVRGARAYEPAANMPVQDGES